MPERDRLLYLLRELDEPELDSIWTTCLKKKPFDKYFITREKMDMALAVSQEWRAIHGHTLRNKFRGAHDLEWKRILIDVVDKMKPGLWWSSYKMDDNHTEDELEEQILQYFDELVKSSWDKLPNKDKEKAVREMNEEYARADVVLRAKGKTAGIGAITLQSLSNGIGVGLLTGGGALLVAQSSTAGIVGGLFGGALYQIGLWVVVRFLGWWSGAQLLASGGAATIGGVLVSTPALIVFTANAFMSTSYRKSIPATLSLLSAHEMRKQLAKMEELT